ncbi:hypothetical protein [Bacterioplanoides sp.]|uniref:hypothetical protein n=1 Tax=Bacterioplanoides sp. TaxID=2066072 RepID=UPI003AFFF45B
MIEELVTQFNETYQVPVQTEPKAPYAKDADLMWNAINEELWELSEALDDKNPIEIADALADIIYVTAQQAVKNGFPIGALLREVHKSNMSKLDANGNPIFREDGKVLKGPNFKAPDIAGVLLKHQLS